MSQIIIVTGPSGAGKSTTCKAFAKAGEGMWAYVGQDDVRSFVKAGYRHADAEWTEETRHQWEVSVEVICDAIKRYYKHGINCIVDCFAPPEEFEKYKQQLGNLAYKVVVLMPDVDQAAYRNSQRRGHARMDEIKIRKNHEWFAAWSSEAATIIDSSKMSVEEVVRQMKELISV